MNKKIRKDFPFLKKVVYLDSAAGLLKPIPVVKAISDFYLKYPMNPHNIDSKYGIIVHNKINETRELIASYLNFNKDEIIFTSGTTDSINKFALMFKNCLKKGDEILLSFYNHSSNIVPWIEIAKASGAVVKYSENLIDGINKNTKLVAFASMNNTIIQNIDYTKLKEKCDECGAILFNDAAQSIVHQSMDWSIFDVIAFSGNKIYGPTGIGVLAIKEKIAKKLNPAIFGGGATTSIDYTEWKGSGDFVANFEAGTPNTAGIIGLGEALKYYKSLGDVSSYEHELANYAFDKLISTNKVEMFSKKGDVNILFNIKGQNSHDVVSYLGNRNIILRSGLHCAHMIKTKGVYDSSIRLSLAFYNTKKEIDKLISILSNVDMFLDI